MKIVSINESKDARAFVDYQQFYRDVVPESNLTIAVVETEESTHCEFTPAEYLAAWQILQNWVATDTQPNANAIQGVCEYIDDTTVFDGPCRYNPSFELPNLDDRVPPR